MITAEIWADPPEADRNGWIKDHHEGNMKCLNVIVFFDNREEVEQYISEVESISNGMVEIALVVNRDSRHDASFFEKRENHCPVHVIRYGENVGYLNALLKTIQNIDLEKYDYYILSNTDIHYPKDSFFESLAAKAYEPNIGCIAPSIYSTAIEAYQNPHYMNRIPREKFERLRNLFYHPALGKLYLSLARMKSKNLKKEKKPSCFPYSPHGAYMIFTRAFLQKIKGYEYGVKLYSEESCIGELLNRHGMKCYYDDSIEVIHRESSVTGKMKNNQRFRAWAESIDYLLKEFYVDE